MIKATTYLNSFISSYTLAIKNIQHIICLIGYVYWQIVC